MLEANEDRRLSEYLTVSKAARYLGVSPWTLRNWDKAGKLTPKRHPKSGYRIYRHEDLQSILDSNRPPAFRKGSRPHFDWSEIGQSEHFVQFYENDTFLVDSVSGYIAAALLGGDGGLVVATEAHRNAIHTKLIAQGVNVSAALEQGRFVALDAAETMSRFMVDGSPDAARFAEVVGEIVGNLTKGGRRLRAFGEMVALLWADGQRAAAIRLEELWNDLARVHSFALFCAYPMSGFGAADQGVPFGAVCGCHSRVIPAESYAALSTPEEQLREISALQQKAQSLHAEIAHRQEVENLLRESEKRQRLLNAKLQESRAAAEHASKAKDQFLAVLSHELRTPLTPVLMSTASMEAESGLSPRMREDLAMIRRNIALETRLIDDLLDLSRVVNGKMSLQKQDVHIHALIQNVVEMITDDAQAKSLTVELHLNARIDWLNADSARLHQVIWNLLHNAVKFTPEGGTVTIHTDNDSDGKLVVQVRDTGIGIEPQALSTVFNAFDQGGRGTDRTFGGLGLGLAIAKAVVDLHGGAMRAHSDGRGKGACFTIELPTVAGANEAASRASPAVKDTGEPGPLRILLVDDHVDTLRAMRRLLEVAGHSVTAAANVSEAVRAAENNGFDLLISDIGLPDGTGLDVVKQAQRRHPGLPAIALTGFGMEQDIRGSREAGFVAHVTKPVDFVQLKKMIQDLTASTGR